MKGYTMTLTTEDLSAIKGVVSDTISETVPEMIQAAIDTLSLQIGEGFNEVTERFEQVEADISDLKTDVAELKTDMREVKWSLADTVRRGEFLDVRTRVERLEH